MTTSDPLLTPSDPTPSGLPYDLYCAVCGTGFFKMPYYTPDYLIRCPRCNTQFEVQEAPTVRPKEDE